MRDLALCLFLFFLAERVNSVPTKEQLESCLSTNSKNPNNLTNYTSGSRIDTAFSESSSPDSSFLNLNFTSLKPILTLKPKSESEIKKAILCSKKLGVQNPKWWSRLRRPLLPLTITLHNPQPR
ncbi:LOW QUALITY PROTEIN: hypothetical protein HID58_041277 [Brassica napus]|uniref:Uncharacterized protein n=1 Tax=Brassica napus TaxID=3708 RepID=A0ABQ8BAE8_BRANA|nr:LOW QUALITY PROTEIN: hypothetical protein HID58_041277 [Brassica napus]